MERLRANALSWREVDGEIVALELSTSTYLAVNATGAALWPLLVEGTTRQDLGQRLVQDYDLAADQAAMDVDAFLAPLQERGLLEE